MIARPDQKVVNLKNFAENVQLELLHYWLEAIHLLEVLKKKQIRDAVLLKTSSKPSKMRFESGKTSTRNTENLAHLTYLHAEYGMWNKSKSSHL